MNYYTLLWILLVGYLNLTTAKAQTPVTQKKCATHHTSQKFEHWLQNKIQQSSKQRTHHEVVTIPVVVHIVHNGEAIGQGTNISKAQVLSQIRILNEDFGRKSGTPGFNSHVHGADVQLEFKLAVRSPSNLPTDGIVRVKGSKTSWLSRLTPDRLALKAHSIWNPAHYLNIWVANIKELGHGQFPVSDLPGVKDDPNAANPEDDGVVVSYEAFGDTGQAKAPYNQGRTTTHEVGHYLGLLHIHGDGDCTVDDFCTDTPPVSFLTRGCPTTPPVACDGTPAQIENYMDYTDDRCMNMFTLQQKTRMRTVLDNSPRRKTLKTSPGLLPVLLPVHGARIEKIESIHTNNCAIEVSPQILIRNTGVTALTSLSIAYAIDNLPAQTFRWTGKLGSLATTLVTLPTTQTTRGKHQITLTMAQPNDQIDVELDQITKEAFVIVPIAPTPLHNDFTDVTILKSQWQIINPDQKTTWEVTELESSAGVKNQVLKLAGFDYEHQGEQDILLSPILQANPQQLLKLHYKVAYAPYTDDQANVSEDGFKVGITNDCGKTFTIIYEKKGAQLATTQAVKESWAPSTPTHWRTENINLSKWSNQDHIQVAFISVNGFGNNIYLDEISITSEKTPDTPEKFVTITPNPGSAREVRFNLQFPTRVANLQWTLINSTGQTVNKGQMINAQFESQHLSTSALPAGIYFLTIQTPDDHITKRIVIY